MVNGVSADGSEASGAMDAIATPNVLDGAANFDVTSTVQDWINGGANFGWELLPLGTDGWRWNSSEAATDELRPTLTISYTTVPEPSCIFALGFSAVL